jgi:PAS domain S-box-containing protein
MTAQGLILIAGPAPASVGVLRSLLEGEGYTALCAYTGREARRLIERHHPALALLDQALPLVDGLELCRELQGERGGPTVFITSERPDELNKLLAFSAGADDYLALPMHPRELFGRVRVALRRATAHTASPDDGSGAAIRHGPIELRPDRRQARVADQEVPLTSLEFELLAIFARNPGRVYSREELLDRLEGFVRGAPLDRAVDIHVSNLRRKLRAALGAGPPIPIETVRGVGYRLRAPSGAATEPDQDAGGVRREARGAREAGVANLERVALAALDHAPVPLLALSLDRTVLLYNQAAQRLCGWTAEEVAGQVKCYSLLGCHNREGALLCYDACPMRTALLSGINEQQARYIIMRKDGTELPVAAHYSRLRPTTGDERSDCVLLVLQPEGTAASPSASAPGEAHS